MKAWHNFLKNHKSSLFYFSVLSAVAITLWIVFKAGLLLERSRGTVPFEISASGQIFDFSVVNLHHPLSILILQILVIIITSRLLGWLMSLISQPTVIGEILAGIMLGPSLLGMYFPDITAFLFPAASLGNIQFLSQIGLILFMFIIGMELDVGLLKKRAGSAIVISNASIIIPYAMGVTLAYFLYTRFAPQHTTFLAFSLFLGIALSITAFPVLARIVQERGLTQTPLGATVITCAAVDDVTAWGILALVVAIANSSGIGGAVITIGLSLVYILLMLMVVRPVLNKIALKYTVRETISKPVVAIVLSTMLVSAWVTEVIGIHALFGAFMAGVIIPDNVRFKQIMAEKIEDVSLVLLLPLFFVYTGLRTQIGLLNDPDLWLTGLIVVVVAVVGKFAGSSLAARFTGQTWKDSLLIGALMNTRGLIELVALNIGYDIGVLSPEIFTILVLMALITTFMTGPSMALINFIFKARETVTTMIKTYNVLISFGPPEAGGRLLNLVSQLFGSQLKNTRVTALHLTPNTEISIKNARFFEEQAFGKVREMADKLGIDVKTHYRTAEAVSQEISKTANRGKYDLLVVGSSRPLMGTDETGGKARYFFDRVKCDVGLVIDRGFTDLQKVLVIMENAGDQYLTDFTAGLDGQSRIDVMCLLPPSVSIHQRENTEHPVPVLPGAVQNFDEYDLIVSSLECYREQRQCQAAWIDSKASVLLISQYDKR
ncbi:MAG: sodium/hydrogen exchanger [Bacteroidetes bacterium]|nr:MAG: sodium/hydrogen exchanger [Bacteroidota bacterium]